MIKIGSPPDVENYVIATDEEAVLLHSNGFVPQWKDDNFIYFLKTDELINFIETKFEG